MPPITAERLGAIEGPVAAVAKGWQMTAPGSFVAARKPLVRMDKIVGRERLGLTVPFDRTTWAVGAAPSLVVENLRQTYGAIAAVESISLAIGQGELVAVVGHSGSGKSTLLRLVAGLERPAAGRIVIGGREVSGPSLFVPPEQRGVGMMFQDYALFPHLTVLRNVMFGLRRLSAAVARQTAREALARVGLVHREGDYPHALSGGEQQRVALARALAPRPNVLLMDEPFSNLDRRTRDIIRDDTATILRDSGATVVLVTHDHDDAMRLADRVMLMQSGRIAQSGSAEDLYRRPASLAIARFFSDFNEFAGICRGGRVSTPLGAFAADAAEGGAVTVCIRPHDVRLVEASAGALPGRIVARYFLGDAQLFEVAVDGLDHPLQVAAPMHVTAAPGSTVGMEIDGADVLVFGT